MGTRLLLNARSLTLRHSQGDMMCHAQDPGARRAMWAYIERAASSGDQPTGAGIALILTTHYMEECEALCSRVGIMHAGKLACLASPLRLKALYGQGYIVEVCGLHMRGCSSFQGKNSAFESLEGSATYLLFLAGLRMCMCL